MKKLRWTYFTTLHVLMIIEPTPPTGFIALFPGLYMPLFICVHSKRVARKVLACE